MNNHDELEDEDLTPAELTALKGHVENYAIRLGEPPSFIPTDFFADTPTPAQGPIARSTRSAPELSEEDARQFFGDPPDDVDDEPRMTSTGRKMTAEESAALKQAKQVIKTELRTVTNATPVELPPTPVTPPTKLDIAPTWSSTEHPFIRTATRLQSTGDPAFAGLVDAVKSVLREHPDMKEGDPSANKLIGERLHQRRALEALAIVKGVSVAELTPDQFIEAVEEEKVRFPQISVELPDFAKMKGSPEFATWFAEWKVELGFPFTFTEPKVTGSLVVDIPVDSAFFDRWHKALETNPPPTDDDRQVWSLIRSSATMTADILIATELSPALYIDMVKEIIEQRKKSKKS